jgi:colanic acid/amylovoran biosynthesis protein
MTFRLALFGASPDTPNMGVSALFASAVEGLTRELDSVEWVIFDNGLGRRLCNFTMSDGTQLPVIHFGARVGRRYHRPENLAVMQFVSRLGTLGSALNEAVRLIDSCDAVLDVSGGDSFSDIYGWKRFSGVYWPKQIALSRHKPLILMPQTYGPYRDAKVLALAESVTRSAAMTWARDPNSFVAMERLLGSNFNPAIHREGVDMAFGLAARDPSGHIPPKLAAWLVESSRSTPLVGLNISGLIYNDSARARSNYHFIADYRTVVTDFVAHLLKYTTARVILISHVMDKPGHYESDLEACISVANTVNGPQAERLIVAPVDLDQSEAKWIISRLDWFCGTRMHATIAGLSTGVPTAAVAYSDKTLGVFATCGQASQVFDPRTLETEPIIECLMQSFLDRDILRQSLAANLPRVKDLAGGQMRDIARHIRSKALAAQG